MCPKVLSRTMSSMADKRVAGGGGGGGGVGGGGGGGRAGGVSCWFWLRVVRGHCWRGQRERVVSERGRIDLHAYGGTLYTRCLWPHPPHPASKERLDALHRASASYRLLIQRDSAASTTV